MKTEFICFLQYDGCLFVDKYAYAFTLFRQVSRTAGDITARMGEKDKPHPVRTGLFHPADIVGLTHTTYFYNHFSDVFL